MPEVPYGLKVLDKSGRSVQLSWAAPYDGNSPIKRYVIEYKISKGSWETDIDRVLVPGSQQNVAGVFNLRPATTYHLRIVAENEIGTSDPSDTVTIITAEEVPSGPPTFVRVEALDQHTLKVTIETTALRFSIQYFSQYLLHKFHMPTGQGYQPKIRPDLTRVDVCARSCIANHTEV